MPVGRRNWMLENTEEPISQDTERERERANKARILLLRIKTRSKLLGCVSKLSVDKSGYYNFVSYVFQTQ